MFKKIIVLVLIAATLNACVSKKVYQELESKYNRIRSLNSKLIEEKDDLLVIKNGLQAELKKLQHEYEQLLDEKKSLEDALVSYQNNYTKLDEAYKALASKSSKKMADQALKNKELLTQLELKEQKLAEESRRLKNLQYELDKRSSQIEELQQLIAAKEAKMQQLKNTISNALHNFEGKGLTVVHKNGKIYVPMENKLLFNSGSWAVGSEGKNAVQQLAGVLSKNTDINVLIEGHTDNVPYNGATLIDNWDLSVKRATAIVRILENNGVNPMQITAAGRSKYLPIENNETKTGKAKNRRIEIILAPNLDQISKLLNE